MLIKLIVPSARCMLHELKRLKKMTQAFQSQTGMLCNVQKTPGYIFITHYTLVYASHVSV